MNEFDTKIFATIVIMLLAGCSCYAFWVVGEQRVRIHETAMALTACQKELMEIEQRAEAKENARLKTEKKAREERETDDTAERLRKLGRELPCWLALNEWTARVEGVARIPPGVFKQAIKGEGPGLTPDQKRRLVMAVVQDPVPRCTEKEGEGDEEADAQGTGVR